MAPGASGPTAFLSVLPVFHAQHQRRNNPRGPGVVLALCVGRVGKGCLATPRVVSSGAGRQTQPALAPAGDGYLVAWREVRGEGATVVARFVDADGRARPELPELVLDHSAVGQISRPKVVSLSEETVVLWIGDAALRAQRIGPEGRALEAEPIVVGLHVYPTIFDAAAVRDERGQERVVALWPTGDGKVHAARLRGGSVDEPLLVATEKKVRAVAVDCGEGLCHLAWLAVPNPKAKPWPHVSVHSAVLREDQLERVNASPSAGAERIARAQLHLASAGERVLLLWESHRHQDHNLQGRIPGPGGASHTRVYAATEPAKRLAGGSFPSDLRSGRALTAAGAGWLGCSTRRFGERLRQVNCYRLSLDPEVDRFRLSLHPVFGPRPGEDPAVAFHPGLPGHGGLVAWQAHDPATGTLRIHLSPIKTPAVAAP